MKQWILLILFLNIPFSLSAQYDNPKEYIFVDYAALSVGSNPSVALSLNFITKNHLHLAIGLVGVKRVPDNLPDNFSSGIFGIKRINQADIYSAYFGKVLYNSRGGTRFRLSGGLGVATVETPFNFTKINQPSILHLGVSHEFETSKSNHFVLSLEPTIDFAMGRGIGFSFKFNTSYIPNFAYVFNMMFSMSFGKVYLRRSQRDGYIHRTK